MYILHFIKIRTTKVPLVFAWLFVEVLVVFSSCVWYVIGGYQTLAAEVVWQMTTSVTAGYMGH
jgi:hypothetical protein